ncbi:hypothetical protein EBH_0002840 [Eimeria brunetti]|uniref:Uncharacterized protein n=1 Tax=Eimeria brunetti TaxID=51314 RepID=U6LS77_9EIME|nr:hypothetical protein EBH_0002840 [Eimeria brunetti]
MTAFSMPKENHHTWLQSIPQLHSDLPTGNLNKAVKDALLRTRCRSCTSARAQRSLSLLSAFAAVTAVVFFAYLCSSLIRRRTDTFSFGRKLATRSSKPEGSSSGKSEETSSDKSDDSESCATDTHEVPGASRDPPSPLTPTSREPFAIESGHGESEIVSPRETVSWARNEGLSHAVEQQLGTAGEQVSVKRKGIENASVERVAKLSKLEQPIQETPPAAPPPPLDPDTEFLIDSILSEGTTALFQGMWVLGDAAADIASSELHSEHAVPSREHLQQQGQAVLASADKISTGSSGSPYTVHESEADGASPLSALESVLAEASHDPEGLLPDDWLQSQEAEGLEEALGMMASDETASAWPSSSEEPKGTAMGHSSLHAATSGGRMDAEALPIPEEPQSDPSREKIEITDEALAETDGQAAQASHEALRMPSTEPRVTPNDGLAESALESSVLRSILLSKSDDSMTLSSSETTDEASAETGGQAAQLLSERAQSATSNLLDKFVRLQEILGWVSDDVLRTHPFYHHPGMQLRLSRRTVNLNTVEYYRSKRQKVVLLLSKFRHLLKKTWLTSEEFDVLVGVTERLCGYASGIMLVDSTAKAAIETLGRVFIVMDTLYCAAEVLGQSSRKNAWWPSVRRHLRDTEFLITASEKIFKATTWGSTIISALSVALDYYKMGERPPLRLVVALKLAIFLLPVPTDFLTIKWDPWRKDAEEWLHSIKQS